MTSSPFFSSLLQPGWRRAYYVCAFLSSAAVSVIYVAADAGSPFRFIFVFLINFLLLAGLPTWVSVRHRIHPDIRGGLAGANVGAIHGFVLGVIYSAELVIRMDWSLLWIYQFALPFAFNGLCFGVLLVEGFVASAYVFPWRSK